MTTLETLVAMRELLAEPERWTKGAFARDANGDMLSDPADKRAACWCLAGAGRKVDPDGPLYPEWRERLLKTIGHDLRLLDPWNDAPERTHAEVLDLLDRAIAEEKAR